MPNIKLTLAMAASDLPKIALIPGHAESSCTFVIEQEDHTLGNSLRYTLMRNPAVQFCGYSMPHPSEQRINLRLQTREDTSATEAFRQGCDSLVKMTEIISSAFEDALTRGPEVPTGSGQRAAGSGAGASSSEPVSAGAGSRSRAASSPSAAGAGAADEDMGGEGGAATTKAKGGKKAGAKR